MGVDQGLGGCRYLKGFPELLLWGVCAWSAMLFLGVPCIIAYTVLYAKALFCFIQRPIVVVCHAVVSGELCRIRAEGKA